MISNKDNIYGYEDWEILEMVNSVPPRTYIVKCKDCKYWNKGTCEKLGFKHAPAEEFCALGEWRGEEDE